MLPKLHPQHNEAAHHHLSERRNLYHEEYLSHQLSEAAQAPTYANQNHVQP
eukprot:Gb_05410 [translate_table: standard]